MEPSEDDLRELATKRVRAKRDFVTHMGVYAVVNAGLVAIWALTGSGYPWFVWPLLGWGIGLALHAVGMMIDLSKTTAEGIDRESRAIEREMQRLRERRAET